MANHQLPDMEAGLLLPYDHNASLNINSPSTIRGEKRLLLDQDTADSILTSTAPASSTAEKMRSVRHIFLVFALCFLVTLGLASAVGPRFHPCRRENQIQLSAPDSQVADARDGSSGKANFAKLLEAASPEALHRLLHEYFPERYQHGVYPSDHDALEAVKGEDAPLATSLANLAKRQGNSNTTTESVIPPSTSSNPPQETTSSQPQNSPTQSTSAAPTTTAPPVNPRTTTSANPPQQGTTTVTRGPDTSPGTLTTTTSSATSSLSEVLTTFTSTKPNGEITIVTQTSYVAVGAPRATTSTARGDGNLQNSGPRTRDALSTFATIVCAVTVALLVSS